MMPLDSALGPFRAILCCAFGAKCLQVIDLVYSQVFPTPTQTSPQSTAQTPAQTPAQTSTQTPQP